jgi:hypothetical protein
MVPGMQNPAKAARMLGHSKGGRKQTAPRAKNIIGQVLSMDMPATLKSKNNTPRPIRMIAPKTEPRLGVFIKPPVWVVGATHFSSALHLGSLLTI